MKRDTQISDTTELAKAISVLNNLASFHIDLRFNDYSNYV